MRLFLALTRNTGSNMLILSDTLDSSRLMEISPTDRLTNHVPIGATRNNVESLVLHDIE